MWPGDAHAESVTGRWIPGKNDNGSAPHGSEIARGTGGEAYIRRAGKEFRETFRRSVKAGSLSDERELVGGSTRVEVTLGRILNECFAMGELVYWRENGRLRGPGRRGTRTFSDGLKAGSWKVIGNLVASWRGAA